MMPLSQIRAFDRTVTEGGRSVTADRFAAPWSHEAGGVRFFRTSANIICTLSRGDERSFLRASAASERNRRTIEDELLLIDTLAEQDVPVVSTILSDRGERIETVETPVGTFHVVLFNVLSVFHQNAKLLPVEDFGRWGTAVGRIHAGLATVPCDRIARAPSWQTALDSVESAADSIPQASVDGAARLRAALELLPRSPDWYGVLHGDLELDNLTWDDRKVWALDFDAASCGWYLLDLAKALSEPIDLGYGVTYEPIAAFIECYRQEHTLPDEAIARLPDFRMLARVVDYAAIRHALDLAVADADVDWLRRLIGGLLDKMHRIETELAAFTPTS